MQEVSKQRQKRQKTYFRAGVLLYLWCLTFLSSTGAGAAATGAAGEAAAVAAAGAAALSALEALAPACLLPMTFKERLAFKTWHKRQFLLLSRFQLENDEAPSRRNLELGIGFSNQKWIPLFDAVEFSYLGFRPVCFSSHLRVSRGFLLVQLLTCHSAAASRSVSTSSRQTCSTLLQERVLP